jgi:GntR family transcriptional regulator
MKAVSDSVPLKSGSPRHEQVGAWIRDQIEQGLLEIDDQLPSESKLCERFSVSRITVRRALQTLEAEGLIYRRQGLGSFVRGEHMRQGFVHLTDFFRDMTNAGIRARSELLAWEKEPASSRVARALGMPEGSDVVRIDRLRLGNDEPVAFDSTWMAASLEQYMREGNLATESIYDVLEKRAGIRISSGRFRMEAMNAPNDVAGHLNIPWGRALLLIERTTFADRGRPVCFQMRYYRSDRVAYELVIDRGDDVGGIRNEHGLPLREFEPVFKKQS